MQVHCSFCAKPSTAVEKVIAGPGVYICNECVRACENLLAAGAGPVDPEFVTWRAMTDDEILEHLPRVAAAGTQVEASLRQWVERARERDLTWTRIGAALGMTRQSAWERFTGETR